MLCRSFVFSFFWLFSEFLCPFESFGQILARFDQDLNMFKTWKWKGNHGSFLVTLKWSFWDVLKFPCLKPKTTSLHDWHHKTEFRVRGRYIHDFLVWICLDLVYQLECLLYIWHKNAMSFVFSFFWFFPEILCPFESFGQILGLTKI